MPNLADHAALATDDGFRRRLQAAVVQRATPFATAAKPTDASKVTGWQEQRTLASSLLASPGTAVERYAWAVAADSAVLGAFVADTGRRSEVVPDAAIEQALMTALSAQLSAQRADTTS